MLTGKQKRFLRAMMVTEAAVIQIGKAGITENLVKQTNETLFNREILKVKVQNNNDEDPEILAKALAEACEAELVQVIGHSFVLYKKHPEQPKIVLPSSNE
ncbi:MAG: ribosome assembly RNA-binding protein YhbY [Negativicutes bacterium]|nr:ribosome assembly RNA-binding protein YhbY [Negativicutes bacterium]